MQDPFPISLFSDGVEVGKIGKMRELPYGLGPTINLGVGTINVGDSMAVIKKLVFDEKKITMKQLLDALDANWEGEENQKIREMCLAVPKYGNDDDETDEVVARIYSRLVDIGCSIDSYRGGKFCVSGLSITAHDPGGRLTGATPDGRYAGAALADGSVSPEQGCDVCGPTAMLNSAMKLPDERDTAQHESSPDRDPDRGRPPEADDADPHLHDGGRKSDPVQRGGPGDFGCGAEGAGEV